MKLFIYIIFFLSAFNLFAQLDSKIIPGDANNFEMSKWDDKTSFLDWKIYGDKGVYKEGNIILISNMKLDIFDGSKEEKKKIEVNSKLAEVYVVTKSAGGDGEIFATGESFDLEGRTWLWESTNRKISIFNSLKINFKNREDESPSLAKSKIGYFYHLKDENIFELERKVSVIDNNSEIECDYLTIKTDKDSMRNKQSSARSIDAKGNVEILWDKQVLAHSDTLNIKPSDDIATLLGNAKLKDLKSDTEVFGAKIELNKKTNKSRVFSQDKERAKAIIPQKSEDGKVEHINIYANDILMTMRDEEVEVNFVGNVILESESIYATCNRMTSLAIKKEGAKDFELLKVIGEGNVSIKQESRTAFAQTFIYTPETSEVILSDNANMQDEDKGVRINAYTIILDRNENNAIAVSKEGDNKSFVHVQINEIKNDSIKTTSQLNIFSRSLITIKDENKITFNFETDVKVKSDNIQAVCQKMNVYANSQEKGRSQISKIEAFEDIIIKQDQYLATAQLARIFPSAKLSDNGGEVDKSYTELLTSSAKPDIRPKIILPPMGNVGLNESITEGKEYKNTEITSDKQSLVEGDDLDRYFFEGNVIVDSTDMYATSKKIELRMTKEEDVSAKKISQIIATENVKITQGLKEATANRCDIFPNEEMLILSESPEVLDRENNSKATGYRMTYRKGKKGISIEGDPNSEKKNTTERKRPTIILPPIK